MFERALACSVVIAAIVVGVAACGGDDSSEEPGPATVGDSCPASGEFACGRDASGENNGELLLCEGGTYILAATCGDERGCFIEDSAHQGRCFHGDGTGSVCRYVEGDPNCCTFTEPTLEC